MSSKNDGSNPSRNSSIKPKNKTVRRTISLSEELDKAMTELSETHSVSWSEIAAKAFEKAIRDFSAN